MQFIAALSTFDEDLAAKRVFGWLEERLGSTTGVCYYKYPIVGFGSSEIPDLTVLVRGYQPFAIKCVELELRDVGRVGDDLLEIRDRSAPRIIDSPFAVAEDFQVWLNQRFERERALRGKLVSVGL